jgi:hypothetical protein
LHAGAEGSGALRRVCEERHALGDFRDGGLIQQAGGPLCGHDFLERGKYPR